MHSEHDQQHLLICSRTSTMQKLITNKANYKTSTNLVGDSSSSCWTSSIATASMASSALISVLGAAADRRGAWGGWTSLAFFIAHVFFSAGADTLVPPRPTEWERGRTAAPAAATTPSCFAGAGAGTRDGGEGKVGPTGRTHGGGGPVAEPGIILRGPTKRANV